MRKIYLILALIPIATLCMGQIGYSWWQFLPADFEENPYPRQTVMVQSATDDTVLESNSLEELWGNIGEGFIYPMDAVLNAEVSDYSSGAEVVTSVPEQSPEDFTGSYTLISGDDALYVLYKVIDDEVDLTKEFVELHYAPYGSKFDPGRDIYPDLNRGLAGHWWADSLSHVWGWDTNTNLPDEGAIIIKGTDYVEMAKYGSWTEVGAHKVDLTLATSAEVFPAALNYTMKGDDKDILGDVRGGALDSPMQTFFEQTSDGYYFLAIVPWNLMPTGKFENVGDQISIALKAYDYDSDNFSYKPLNAAVTPHTYQIAGGTDQNDAYWAIAYYGAIAELSDAVLSSNEETLKDNIEAFYTGNQLLINSTSKNLTVNVFDINGKVSGVFTGKHQIDMSFLNAGFYFANISDDQGNRSVVKFVRSTY